MWACQRSRPDISFATCLLSSHAHHPTPNHLTAAKSVLSYLNGTLDFAIKFPKCLSIPLLVGYVDSEFGGDLKAGKPRYGYIIYFLGAPIHWAARQQKLVAKSSMDAEIVALSELVRETRWIRDFIQSLGIYKELPPARLYCDNNAAIAVTTGTGTTPRSRHMAIHYMYVREAIELCEVEVRRVDTSLNIADGFTKLLPPQKHRLFKERLCSEITN